MTRQAYRVALLALTGGLLLILSGCIGANPAEESAATQNAVLSTQVAQARASATTETDRYRATLENLQTATSSAGNRRIRLESTLQAMGFERGAFSAITPVLPTATRNTTGSASANAAGPGGGVTRIAPTPEFRTAIPTPTVPFVPTVDTSGPYFSNISTSSGVGEDDCAVGVTDTFTTDTVEIYIVMTAHNIEPGTVLLSRWFKDGAEAVMHDFVPNFEINGACIWFYTDQTEMEFTPGSTYNVSLEINGVPFGQPVNFSIAGDALPESTVAPPDLNLTPPAPQPPTG